MNNKKKIKIISLFSVLTLYLLILSLSSSSERIIPKRSIQLEKLRIEAINKPCRKTEIAYLNAFPKTFKEFCNIFHNINFDTLVHYELTDKHMDHLDLLEKLSKKYPDRVLSIWLNVSIGGEYIADATAFLHYQFRNYVAKNTKHFAIALEKKSKPDQLSIIKFLADVESFYSYNEYKIIIKNLIALKKNKLAQYFIKAREERKKHRKI